MDNTSRKVYSDGAVEKRIQEYLQSHNGDSTGIISAIPDGAVFHNFTKARENLLRWYPFEKNSRVLEVGAGMGAMTTYLASVCENVVALEPSPVRANIITLRCSKQDNVRVVQSTFDEYCATDEKFDYVLLLGVLEYAGVYSEDANPWLKMLTNAQSMLKENGKLLLAIENKYGLKYWCGAAEDHTGVPFDSINDYQKSGGTSNRYIGERGIKTFSKADLEKMLCSAGFSKNRFFYVLPDYKFPMLSLTDETVGADQLVSDVKYSYPMESMLVANEAQVLPEIVKNGTLGFFANSYLVEACNRDAEPCTIATVTMKRDCKSIYRLITAFCDDKVMRISGSEDSRIHLRELVENTENLSRRGIPCVEQKWLSEDAIYMQFIDSPRADRVFISALRDGNIPLALKIIDLLIDYVKKSGELVFANGQLVLKVGYPDLTLRNCFWANEDLIFFDQEWKTENVPFRYVLYRSIRYSMMMLSDDMKTFILDYCGITSEWLEKYEAMEEEYLHSLMDEENCSWFDPAMCSDNLKLEAVFQRQIDNKQAHIELLLQSERDLQKQASDLTQQLTEKEREYRELWEKDKNLEDTLAKKESECQKLREKQVTLMTSLEEKESEYRHIKESKNTLKRLQAERENECLFLQENQNKLKKSLVAQTEKCSHLEYELACRETECQQLRNKENRYLNELAAIKATRSWRLGRSFAKFARFFVPIGSKRAVFVRMFVTMVKHPGKFLSCLTPKKFKKFFRLLRRGNTEQIQALVQLNVTGQPIPSALEVMVPEIAPVKNEAIREKTAADYPVLAIPQWENPTVSIVIPVYNQFEYTYRCVESILKNSGDITYEILIGNDCSTDLTTQIDSILPGVKCITNEKNLRFVRNCNNAAKYARGKYLLFLNNDTQVQKNWLEPLVTLIESADDIGMVGSKLIYPDGLLQEAGGILWRDGSAWNFGNRQNPSNPEFNYVKEVDYISGASIMLSRALWEEIGGFDELFAPAYCDDSDLAFTVRKKGYRVMYQPKSVVVHFEGVSNGTDTASGQKQYQIVNSQKFFEKWKEVLASHPKNGDNVFQARDRSYGKKTLLMVDHYVPQYDKDAGSRTVYQYLKLFVSLGFNVKFIGDNFFQHEPYTSVLQQMGIEVLYGPDYAANWKNWIRDNGEHIDYVFLNRPHIAPKYMDAVRQYTNAKVIYYGHDLGFLREMREYEVTGDISFEESSMEWQSKELDLMRKADCAYYPSYVEVDTIHAIDSQIRVKAIPAYLFDNVQWEGFDFETRKDIMFIGGFSHRPNVDAVKWLAKDILPKLVKRLPDIKIHILGSNAPRDVMELANDHLIMEGFVTDEVLEQFYRSCRISFVPLRYGAGIKGKVVEAMRFGTPVVTTSTGAEGIPNAEKAMLVEDDATMLAEKIAALYQNADILTAMSKNSISYVQENYSIKNAIKVISSEFDLQGKDINS